MTPPATETPKPGSNEVIYGQFNERLTEFGAIMRDNFTRSERTLDKVESKLDKLVSKPEFDAVVKRLDIKDDEIETKLNSGLEGLRSEMSVGINRVSLESQKGFNDIAEETEKRNMKNRWFWGIIIGAATLVNGALWNLLSFVFP